MMEIARNPSRLQEMTRNMDRQMSNLESMPGGQVGAGATITITTTTSLSLTTTPSLTTTLSPQAILQRMYRDVQEPVLNAMGGPNPFQDLRGQAAAPAPTPSTETTAPAPNPWAPPAGATPATTGAPPAPGLGAALGQGGGVFTSPGMQSLMGQMRDNPTLMSQVTWGTVCLESCPLIPVLSCPDYSCPVLTIPVLS